MITLKLVTRSDIIYISWIKTKERRLFFVCHIFKSIQWLKRYNNGGICRINSFLLTVESYNLEIMKRNYFWFKYFHIMKHITSNFYLKFINHLIYIFIFFKSSMHFKLFKKTDFIVKYRWIKQFFRGLVSYRRKLSISPSWKKNLTLIFQQVLTWQNIN